MKKPRALIFTASMLLFLFSLAVYIKGGPDLITHVSAAESPLYESIEDYHENRSEEVVLAAEPEWSDDYALLKMFSGKFSPVVDTGSENGGDSLQENTAAAAPETENRFHLVTILVSNWPTYVLTETATVGELLAANGIVLGENDISSHPEDSVIDSSMTIRIDRVVYEERTEYLYTSPSNVTKRIFYLSELGRMPANKRGKDGKTEIVYRDLYVNGELVGSEEISREVISRPVSGVIYEKYDPSWSVSSLDSLKIRETDTYSATAYCKEEGLAGQITALGYKTDFGMVAVSSKNPGAAKLGDWVYIEAADGSFDYGYAYVCDVGGSRDPNWIDLYFDSSEDMNAFGKRKVIVHVLEEKPDFIAAPKK